MLNRTVLLVLSIFIFSSCVVVENTQLELVKPAELTLPSQINSIALLNHSVLEKKQPFETKVQQGLFRLDSVTSQVLVAKVYEEFYKSPRFTKVEMVENPLVRQWKQITKPTPWSVVSALCDSLSVDALLSMEALAIIDTLKKYSYNDGYSTITYQVITLNTHALWRLYVPGVKNIVHKQIFSDTILLDELENYGHLEKILKRKEGVGWLAHKITEKQYMRVSDKFAPFWVVEPRVYYRGINTDFRLAGKYAKADQWLKAAEIWQKHTEAKQKYVASAASFNMAVVCEVQGKLPLAKAWVDKSIEFKTNQLNKSYKEILEKRLIEVNQLNNQFGIIE